MGKTLTGLIIKYEGELITPTHFNMKPVKPYKSKTIKRKGKIRKQRQRYSITAEIIKGQRKELHPDAFLGTNKGGGYIPFRRRTNKAKPIDAIKSVSMPQMVRSEKVYPAISVKVNSELEKRLEHNMKRFLDK